VSVKLRAAFEKSDNSAKKNFAFKLHVSDCDIATVEVVLQFVYTGAIVLPHNAALDITQILSAGQKLGLDASKLASCLGAILCLTDARFYIQFCCPFFASIKVVIIKEPDFTFTIQLIQKCTL